MLPVMFRIHGGGLQVGNGNWWEVGMSPSTELARGTGMVYISINYRLNAFGFMALDWLREKSQFNTSGNYGFMDMIEGLRWVQRNVRHFGGDPNHVTLFGQSSGATSVFALLASPLWQGLFHRAILMSASPVLNKTASDAFKDNEVFIRNTNCTNVECLYNLTSKEVMTSVPWDEYPFWHMSDQLGLPVNGLFDGAIAVVDGHVLPEAPFEAWIHGKGADVPLIIGTTAQETAGFTDPVSARNWTWDSGEYEKYVRQNLGQFSDVIAETALKLYSFRTKTPEYEYTSMISDARISCGNDYLCLVAATAFTSPVYRYVTTYSASQPVFTFSENNPAKYAFHGIDAMSFFGRLRNSPSKEDLQYQKLVRDEIAAFAKTGRPMSEQWKPYPTSTAILSHVTNVTHAYHAVECQFWMKNGFFSYSWIN